MTTVGTTKTRTGIKKESPEIISWMNRVKELLAKLADKRSMHGIDKELLMLFTAGEIVRMNNNLEKIVSILEDKAKQGEDSDFDYDKYFKNGMQRMIDKGLFKG